MAPHVRDKKRNRFAVIHFSRFFDPPGRLPFHQIGHPLVARNLWPLEQAFQPPRFAFAIGFPIDVCGQSSFYHARNLDGFSELAA